MKKRILSSLTEFLISEITIAVLMLNSVVIKSEAEDKANIHSIKNKTQALEL